MRNWHNVGTDTGQAENGNWENDNPHSWQRRETRFFCSICGHRHDATYHELVYSGLPLICPKCHHLMNTDAPQYTYDEKSYAEYIMSDGWRHKSHVVKMLAGYKCKLCGSAKNLVTHHVTYKNVPMEREEDLLCVCERCHKRLHKNDIEEMQRREEMAKIKADDLITYLGDEIYDGTGNQ